MERVSKAQLREFLTCRPYAVVHFDAEWDGYRIPMSEQMRNIEQQFAHAVSFGYMDCDADQDYAKALGLRNVPSIAYYSGSALFGLVVGIQQDIAQNIERMMRGEHLDETNTTSRGAD